RWHGPILLPRASCLGIGSGLLCRRMIACNVSHVTYLRYPHVHADLITFTADDDVWLVPSSGGRAWRLASDHVPVRSPPFLPHGAARADGRRGGHRCPAPADLVGFDDHDDARLAGLVPCPRGLERR